MQPQLFTKKQMQLVKAPKEKKPKKIYGPNNCFHFGKYAFKYLSWVAEVDPDYLLTMQSQYGITLSPELINKINQAKYLGQ